MKNFLDIIFQEEVFWFIKLKQKIQVSELIISNKIVHNKLNQNPQRSVGEAYMEGFDHSYFACVLLDLPRFLRATY